MNALHLYHFINLMAYTCICIFGVLKSTWGLKTVNIEIHLIPFVSPSQSLFLGKQFNYSLNLCFHL